MDQICIKIKWLEMLKAKIKRVLLWRTALEPKKTPFFIDPTDHIGKERLATGEPYEWIFLLITKQLVIQRQLSSSDAMDVGANIGNHTIEYAKMFNRVHAFEPNRVARYILEANVILSGATNVTVKPYGLGDSNAVGSLEQKITANLGSCKFIKDNGSNDSEIRVGDEILDTNNKIGLIKIDVEGMELQVLRGLQQTIKLHRPIICVEIVNSTVLASVKDFFSDLNDYDAYSVKKPNFNILNVISVLAKGAAIYELAKFDAEQYNGTAISMMFMLPR